MTDWNAIRRAIEEATPGPWEAVWRTVYWSDSGHEIASVHNIANVPFVITARTAMPDMLALLVEARGRLEYFASRLHRDGPIGEHWTAAGPMRFDDCDAPECESARDLIARLPEAEK